MEEEKSWYKMKMGVSSPDESISSTSPDVFLHIWQGQTDAVFAAAGRQVEQAEPSP